MIAVAEKPKKKRKARVYQPFVIVGGIDPHRTYALHEFLAITHMTRQRLSLIRRQENGLIVRDAGVPTVLGRDWLDFVARQKPHVAKPRGLNSSDAKRGDEPDANKIPDGHEEPGD